jgi:hypothetical protein
MSLHLHILKSLEIIDAFEISFHSLRYLQIVDTKYVWIVQFFFLIFQDYKFAQVLEICIIQNFSNSENVVIILLWDEDKSFIFVYASVIEKSR